MPPHALVASAAARSPVPAQTAATSLLVLTELRLIERIFLSSQQLHITAGLRHTQQGKALLAQLLFDTHGIGLVQLTGTNAGGAGGAHACTTGARQGQIGRLRRGQDGLIAVAREGVRLAFQFQLHLKGVRHRHQLLSGPS